MSKIVFVGANSDIAKATLPLLQAKQDVVLITRDTTLLPDAVQSQYECYSCNPCKQDEMLGCFESILVKQKIAAAVNFCGNIMLKPAAVLTPSDWQKTIEINLTTAFNVAHATTKLVKKECALIFFSTAAAHLGLPNHEAIAAAKAGIEGLSMSIAASYARQNIRSNVIAPGLIQSKLSAPITKSDRGKSLSLSLHGLNRLGKPEDIARMVIWLLAPENNWLTGEVIRIDGGLSTIKRYLNH